METKTYSFGKGLLKAVIGFIIFAIPFALQATPDAYLKLTVGAVIAFGYNALKFWFNNTFM